MFCCCFVVGVGRFVFDDKRIFFVMLSEFL